MPKRSKLSTLREISDINLTPLMDLTFILLITFIITFPLIEQGIPVNLPRGKAEELQPDRFRTISLDLEGRLYLDDIGITKDELAGEMNALGQADPDMTVMVRADEGIKYGSLVEVLRILHDAGIARMALVTQAEDAPGAMRDLFRHFLFRSAAVHVGVVVFVVVIPFVMHSCHRKKKSTRTVTFVDLQTAPMEVPSVVPVQEVTPPAPPKDIPEPPKKKAKKPIKKSTKRVKRDEKPPAKSSQLTPEEIRKLLESGVKPSTTTARPDDDFPFSWYLALVRQRMYEAWAQPSELSGAAGLVTEVAIRVERDGRVTRRDLVGSSGNTLMDDSVMKAVESVSRLRALPPQFSGKHRDITIEFELTTSM